MYRAVKIKAFIVFLAWGVVFLHGVIPHIHLNEQHGYCHSLLHDSDASEQESSDADHLNGGHNDNEKVCHFSTIMYQQPGFEELLADTSHKPQIIPEANIHSVIACYQGDFISPAETGPFLLRAPPLV